MSYWDYDEPMWEPSEAIVFGKYRNCEVVSFGFYDNELCVRVR